MTVEAFPNNGYAPTGESIASHLREIAQWIEEGEEVANIYMIFEKPDGKIYRRVCGQPVDRARVCGVLQMAATFLAMDEL